MYDTNLSFIILLCYYLFLFAYSVLSYVFQGVSLYKIAKRRGLSNPGLAWVPIGRNWLLGAIGDQYESLRTGKKRNLRWWLLGLDVVLIVIFAAMVFCMIITVVRNMMYFDTLYWTDDSIILERMLPALLMLLLQMLVLWAIAIADCVLISISLHRLYQSARPQSAVVFLVLSILFPITIPFFLFACRKYDAPIVPAPYFPAGNFQQPEFTPDIPETDTDDVPPESENE